MVLKVLCDMHGKEVRILPKYEIPFRDWKKWNDPFKKYLY
jgi:hypothetical protein